MLRRTGLIVAGLFLSAVLANVYYVGFCMVFIIILGIQDETFLKVGFWACFAAAAVTIAYLFRGAWSPAKSNSNEKNITSD